MSATQTPIIPPPDKTATVSKLAVSIAAQVVFFACLGIAYWTKDSNAISLLVGAAVANSTTVVNYWLGSSSGSSAKDATIAAKSATQGNTP